MNIRVTKASSMVRVLLIVVAVAASVAAVSAQSRPSRETQIKAVWLFKFLSYATWPSDAFPNREAPFVLGIYGKDPFGQILKPVERKTVRNRPIELRYPKTVEEAKQSHVLFISADLEGEMKKLLDELRDSSVLTVGESPNFTDLGGIINLTYGKKTPLSISQSGMNRAKVQLHAQLKALGQLVK